MKSDDKPIKILAFAGSLREGSFNKKLIAVTVQSLKDTYGEDIHINILDLREVGMPLYDGDLEEKSGLPDGAVKFRQRIEQADALIISTPEYNNSIPGVLKNAIDWASRPPGDVFDGKIALLMGASVGGFGALRGIMALRQVLRPLGVVVIPSQITVSRAHNAFTEDGALKDSDIMEDIQEACDELIELARAL